MRARRQRMSWIVSFKTWPSVSTPVTFGGGITIENGGFDDFEFATKSRSSIQCRYHFGSTAFGSYLFGSSAIAINHPKAWRVCKGESVHFADPRMVSEQYIVPTQPSCSVSPSR